MSRNRIDQTFARLRSQGRRGLIPFLAAGDPSLDVTEALVSEFEARGADIVELGVPFSDPLADGVVNQRAYQRALESGANLPRILELVARIRTRSEIPIVLMTYINPVHRFGLQRFPRAARDDGVDGLIVSDCPPEEMGELQIGLEGAGVHSILLIAPTSPTRRISLISAKSQGYIYYVSLRGVTGPRDYETRYTYAYSKIVGLQAGGDSVLKKYYIQLVPEQQIYEIPAGRELNELLWYSPPELNNMVFDPWSFGFLGGTGLGGPGGFSQIGRGGGYTMFSGYTMC